MARIRTIKPEFFTSADIVGLSPMARLLFIALWCESDKEGRLSWKPRTFKLRYFPGDKCDIDGMCAELVAARVVRLYGDGLAYIPGFSKHQHVNPRESKSTLPEPGPEPKAADAADGQGFAPSGSGIDASILDSHAQVGREGRKGKEHASRRVAGRFDEFWASWPKSERKQDKAKCHEKWIERGLDALADEILADVALKKQTDKWQKGFIEAPEVYINNKRWEDGVEPDSFVGRQEAFL